MIILNRKEQIAFIAGMRWVYEGLIHYTTEITMDLIRELDDEAFDKHIHDVLALYASKCLNEDMNDISYLLMRLDEHDFSLGLNEFLFDGADGNFDFDKFLEREIEQSYNSDLHNVFEHVPLDIFEEAEQTLDSMQNKENPQC